MSQDKKEPILVCPQCKEYIIIRKINCGIFRHGVLKKMENKYTHTLQKTCAIIMLERIKYMVVVIHFVLH